LCVYSQTRGAANVTATHIQHQPACPN
jgi:hypothetical protein